MTIWCVCNRPDQPLPTTTRTTTIKSKTKSITAHNSLSSSALKLTFVPSSLSARPANSKSHPSFVERRRMHSIALKLSQCWQLLVFAIFISVIGRTTSTVGSDNAQPAAFAINSNANFASSSSSSSVASPNNGGFNFNSAATATKLSSTAVAAPSTWPSNFFDSDRIQCPSFVDNSACPCYKFEDGNLILYFTRGFIRIYSLSFAHFALAARFAGFLRASKILFRISASN